MPTQTTPPPAVQQETHLMLVRLLTVAELLSNPRPKRDDSLHSEQSSDSAQKPPNQQADV